AEPLDRGGRIAPDAATFEVQVPEVVLRGRQPLICGAPVPARGGLRVRLHHPTFRVEDRQLVLGDRHSLVAGGANPLDPACDVLRDPWPALKVEVAQVVWMK